MKARWRPAELRGVTLDSLEREAEQLARHIATDRLPPDAGAIAKLLAVVRKAHHLGGQEFWEEQMAEADEEHNYQHRAGYPAS